jgi:hypothetical protein
MSDKEKACLLDMINISLRQWEALLFACDDLQDRQVINEFIVSLNREKKLILNLEE